MTQIVEQGRRRPSAKRPVMVRLDPTTHKALERVAREQNRSLGNLGAVFIKAGLESAKAAA